MPSCWQCGQVGMLTHATSTRQRRKLQTIGAKLFFVDEAHCYADVDRRGKWVLRGQPTLVDSSSPRWGEQASYSSGVCLETGQVEVMEFEGHSSAATSVT